MKTFIVFLLWISMELLGSAQIKITFSQQGAEALMTVAGKKIRGEGICGVVLQNEGIDARVIEPGDVYAAAGNLGISYILPHIAIPTVSRTQAISWPALALDGVGLGSQLIGTGGITKAIKMSNGLAIILTVGVPITVNYIKAKLASVQPASSVMAVDLLQSPVALKARTSALVLIVYRYQKDWDPKEITLP